MTFNPEIPYNGLPEILPEAKHWRVVNIYEQASKANRALGELKGRLSSIPNPKIFLNTLALQEAKDSSSIENIFTTYDKLFKAFSVKANGDPNTKEVLRYGKALMDVSQNKNIDTISIELIESIYRNIKDEKDGIRDFPVYIGNRNTIIYTPPCCKNEIHIKLNNWLSVANSDIPEIDPLIKMAILHYQFEAIHPFKDGNGRTGRIINVLLLSAYGLMNEPILYLSKYINEHRKEYYHLLLDVTKNQNWEGWILYVLRAVEETSKYTLEKVLEIIKLFNDTKEQIQKKAPQIYSYELLEILFTQVYSKYAFLVQRKIASRNTASKYLNELVKIGILEKEKIANEFVFKNTRLYNIFSD